MADGAKDVEIIIDRLDDIFSLAKKNKLGGLLIDTRVTITAIGKPQFFFEEK
jgi:hypothetical protein